MARLYSELAKFATKEIDGKKAIQLAKSIWTVGEEEGYTSERGRLAHDAAIIALHHSEYVVLHHSSVVCVPAHLYVQHPSFS